MSAGGTAFVAGERTCCDRTRLDWPSADVDENDDIRRITTSPALNKILFLRIDLAGVFECEGGKILLILFAPASTLFHDGHAGMSHVVENNRRKAETLRQRQVANITSKYLFSGYCHRTLPPRNTRPPIMTASAGRDLAGSHATICSNKLNMSAVVKPFAAILLKSGGDVKSEVGRLIGFELAHPIQPSQPSAIRNFSTYLSGWVSLHSGPAGL